MQSHAPQKTPAQKNLATGLKNSAKNPAIISPGQAIKMPPKGGLLGELVAIKNIPHQTAAHYIAALKFMDIHIFQVP